MDFLTVYAPANASATDVLYVPVPYRCVILSIDGSAAVDIGDNMEFTFYNGGVKQATFDLGADIAIGETGAATIDATTVFEKGEAIKINLPNATAAGEVIFVICLDPFLAGASERNS